MFMLMHQSSLKVLLFALSRLQRTECRLCSWCAVWKVHRLPEGSGRFVRGPAEMPPYVRRTRSAVPMSISSRAGLVGDGGKQLPRDRGHSSVVAISAAIVTPKHKQVRQPDRAYPSVLLQKFAGILRLRTSMRASGAPVRRRHASQTRSS